MTKERAESLVDAFVEYLDAHREYAKARDKAIESGERNWDWFYRDVIDAEEKAKANLVLLLMDSDGGTGRAR